MMCAQLVEVLAVRLSKTSLVSIIFLHFLKMLKAFRTFCRKCFSSEGELFLRNPAKFDATVTKAIDSFKFKLQDLQEGARFIEEKKKEALVKVSVQYLLGTKSYARFEKGGVILHKSAMRLKTLYPKAAAYLYCEHLDLFKTNTKFR